MLISVELYTQLIQENARLKGKEDSVEERIELARDAGYYQGRATVYEEIAEKYEPEETVDPIGEMILYKTNLINILENEKHRLRHIESNANIEIPEAIMRMNGKIEGIDFAIDLLNKEEK